MKTSRSINIYRALLLFFLLYSLESIAQNNTPIAIERFQSELLPDRYDSPRVIVGTEEEPAQLVVKLVFDLHYDTLIQANTYEFADTWFNADGLASVTIEDFPSEKRRRVTLTRTDGSPVSGYGEVYADGGLGIIDVVEVRLGSPTDPVHLVEVVEAKNQNFTPPLLVNDVLQFQTAEPVSVAHLVDIKGNIVWKQSSMAPGFHRIPATNLPSGIYFLRLFKSNRVDRFKILILH